MAQMIGASVSEKVFRPPNIEERVESYLPYLESEWADVPSVAQEWAGWEEHERLDFVVEWPIREDRLHQLQAWAAEGLLSPEHQKRLEALLKLVGKHRPTLERLLQD